MKNFLFFLFLLFINGRVFAQTWNNPHLQSGAENVGYFAFTNSPKTLDPARAYSSDESIFIAQIYEPPLQYAYLLRPYTLVPLVAAQLPTVRFFDINWQPLPDNSDPKKIAYSVYDITINPGIFYQPHPAFAKNQRGEYRYHRIKLKDLANVHKLTDFKYTGTRELTAEDYVYGIKRLADPIVQSPIFGFMSGHILGLEEYSKQLQNVYQQLPVTEESRPYLDLRQFNLEGAQVIDRYHYQIKIRGFYPQFKYWLAMLFFSPVPWEAAYFYSQPGMMDRNITLDWYPVGTGPYLLSENNPNLQMTLTRNPNFHGEMYPTEGEPGDEQKGYLKNSGKPLPFIDAFVFTLDKESIPRWNKFMQGYYDQSGVSADSFDQVIHLKKNGQAELTTALKNKGIHLTVTVDPAIYYMGFNMLDTDVGGYSVAKQKLRQAISIAIDEEEYISIFLNGRGIPAQGPLPLSIFGNESGEKGINPWVYDWKNNQAVRKPLSEAQRLLAEAGFPNGKDPRNGQALLLNYDTISSGSPDDNAQYSWFRKQFAKLGIQLNIRATLYNRFQDKVQTGGVQMFSWGWVADYPDPENFMFLLYGPNSKVKYGGENATNYMNPEADQLFIEVANLSDNTERQEKINQWLSIVRQDAPWMWGFYPVNFALFQPWMTSSKPNAMTYNTLKYLQLDGNLRAKLRHQWNSPVAWPVWLLVILFLCLFLPLIWSYWQRERRSSIGRFS